ncbi:hypothetical protein CJ030_MR7G012475 [Morella rubra]|uniref:Uncharacterized protein n=1 Tax=Morella rubra TaxID=262757 RepID=A0A6A1V488_9ROSI|nr:hypothetical protein CJ030_MR7G012475 [Morella rubra]
MVAPPHGNRPRWCKEEYIGGCSQRFPRRDGEAWKHHHTTTGHGGAQRSFYGRLVPKEMGDQVKPFDVTTPQGGGTAAAARRAI